MATLSFLYALNMYFQSFGAVSIVKVNASWFHVRERGQLGGIFGILISLGIYFAYDWSRLHRQGGAHLLGVLRAGGDPRAFVVLDFFVIRDTPGDTGHPDFDTADASSGDTGPAAGARARCSRRCSRNPVILTILCIEFCSGFLRNAIMQWYPKFAKATGIGDAFVAANWGMLLCVAGITGGMFAGVISDRVFDSRRGPVSAVLYARHVPGRRRPRSSCSTAGAGLDGHLHVPVRHRRARHAVRHRQHGLRRQEERGRGGGHHRRRRVRGHRPPVAAARAASSPRAMRRRSPANWCNWPMALLPLSFLGLLLATRVWNARPQPKAAPAARSRRRPARPVPAPAPALTGLPEPAPEGTS